jgi:hypothetical protein
VCGLSTPCVWCVGVSRLITRCGCKDDGMRWVGSNCEVGWVLVVVAVAAVL